MGRPETCGAFLIGNVGGQGQVDDVTVYEPRKMVDGRLSPLSGSLQ